MMRANQSIALIHELKQAVEEDPLGIGENVTQEEIAITQLHCETRSGYFRFPANGQSSL
jgi:hypothetical protein